MGVLSNKVKYGLVIILLLLALHCFHYMRTGWLNKRTAPVYGFSGNITSVNNTVANMTASRFPSKLRGVDEATMIRPLGTKGRVRLLRERCKLAKYANQQQHRQNISRRRRGGHAIHQFTNQLFFCDIPKTGSSFLNHFLRDKHRAGITASWFLKHHEKHTRSTPIIFVREPFSRFVSGYISKLFFVFEEWFEFKRHVSQLYRVKPSCGDDLKFSEFIKYVLHQLQTTGSTDRHWGPHSSRCLPCQVRYNFIGKLRTANYDIQMVIDKFNLSKTQTGHQYWRQYQKEDIHGMVMRAFVANNCTTLPQALERVWVAFQMRGVISHTAHFPYAAVNRNKYPDIDSIYNMILKSRVKYPVTLKTKTFVKKIVLRHAFFHVDANDIDKIRKLYYNDFYLYGYDMYPDFLTDKIPLTIDGWQPFKLKL